MIIGHMKGMMGKKHLEDINHYCYMLSRYTWTTHHRMLLSDGWSVHCPCATRLLALGINRPKSCLQLAGRMPCKQEMTLTIENRRQFTTKPAKNMQKPGKWYQMINDQANSSEDRFKSDLIGLYSNLILTPGTNETRLPPRTSAQRFESLLLRQRPHTTSVILKLWSCLNKWALFNIHESGDCL